MKTATVLGLSWGYHDAACNIVKDGNIIDPPKKKDIQGKI